MMKGRISRRSVLQGLSLGTTAVLLSRHAAADAPAGRLDVKDPQAKALGYVVNASQIDVKRFPSYVPGSNCENCLQLSGQPGNNYRPCATFKGKLVSVSGWCSAWTPEM